MNINQEVNPTILAAFKAQGEQGIVEADRGK